MGECYTVTDQRSHCPQHKLPYPSYLDHNTFVLVDVFHHRKSQNKDHMYSTHSILKLDYHGNDYSYSGFKLKQRPKNIVSLAVMTQTLSGLGKITFSR